MGALWSISRRDIIAAFTSPLAWLLLAAWSALTNAIFIETLSHVQGKAGSVLPLFVNALSIGMFFLALLAPAVTMGSFANERSQGTMQLLLTAPLREYQLVLGKFLATFLILATLIACTAVHPIVLLFISTVDGSHLASGYLGLLLECAFFAALGNWISLLVDSPVAAYVLTFGALAVLFMIGIVGPDSWLSGLGTAIGLNQRAEPFFAGDVRLGSVAYFLAGTAGFLVLAHSALCTRRLHG